MNPLSRALKIIRQYHRLKQHDLAKRIGVSPSYISEIEKGTKNPTLDILNKYSKTFDIPVSSILFFSELQERSPKSASAKIADKALKILEWISETKNYATN